MTELRATYDRILAETHALYRQRSAELRHRGYFVMYGPLLDRPPIVFVGYQPGGNQTDPELANRPPQPDLPVESFYATDDWKLAVVMRKLWGRELLAASTGLNAIFVRSPRIDVFEREVPKHTRRAIEQFCVPKVAELVEAMRPELVVAIGFRTLELFSKTEPVLWNAKGRALVKRGMIGRMPAIATLHLSGSRIAAADLEAIGSFVVDQLGKAVLQ